MTRIDRTAEFEEMIAVQRQTALVFGKMADAIKSTPFGEGLDFLGFGIDICFIPDMAEAIADKGFAERYFTQRERIHCGKSAGRFAANFAIKEAVIKTIKEWPEYNPLSEIEVLHESSGAPFVRLTGTALRIADGLGAQHFIVSASHEGNFAIGTCLGFGRQRFQQPLLDTFRL